jgi:hypothetical protein
MQLGPYLPITALTTAFNAQTFTSTGAATAVTTPATTDGLAHLVTLVAPVQATLAGVTFTIVGTDANDAAQTETGLVGPASGATVTSTKHFKMGHDHKDMPAAGLRTMFNAVKDVKASRPAPRIAEDSAATVQQFSLGRFGQA